MHVVDDNVVNLKSKILKKQQLEVQQRIQEINDIINMLLANIDIMLEQHGLVEHDEEYSKNFYYVAEALRSLVLHHFRLNHPFQRLVEKSVGAEWNAETNSWELRWDELFLKKLDIFNENE